MQLTDSQIVFLEKVIRGRMTDTEVQGLAPTFRAIWDSAVSESGVAYSEKPHAYFYLVLAEMVKDQPDVDVAVELWLRGAAEVNIGEGSQSTFIREYNNAQAAVRKEGGSVTPEQMNEISNDLADNVFRSIEEDKTVPTINQIATHDAEVAAKDLYKGLGVGGWAGNPLFVLLGEDQPFQENIIGSVNGTYDAFAMIRFLNEFATIGSALDLAAQWWSYGNIFNTDLGDGVAGLAEAAEAKLEIYFQDQYGSYGSNLHLYSAGLGSLYSGDLEPEKIVIGQQFADDTITVTKKQTDIVHSGGGDDTIVISRGGVDFVDGGLGNDTVSIADVEGGRFFYQETTTDAEFTGFWVPSGEDVSSWGDNTTIFNVEGVALSSGDDILELGHLSGAPEFDGGIQGDIGDTIDVSGISGPSGLTIDLTLGTISDGESTVIARAFENVLGSNNNDTIEGSAADNILVGGAGIDQISGGAGDDILIVDFEDFDYQAQVLPEGGEGRDVLYMIDDHDVDIPMWLMNIEVAVGGSGDDWIDLDRGEGEVIMAAGGAGNDVFHVRTNLASSDSPVVLWGGSGSDEFKFYGTARIMVVEVAGLTTQNFADFDLSLLELGAGFDWSAFDAVVINPDAEDKFFGPNTDPWGTPGSLVQLGASSFTYEVWDSPGRQWGNNEPPGFYKDEEVLIGSFEVTTSTEDAKHFTPLVTGLDDSGSNGPDDNVSIVSNFNVGFFGSKIARVQTQIESYLQHYDVLGAGPDYVPGGPGVVATQDYEIRNEDGSLRAVRPYEYILKHYVPGGSTGYLDTLEEVSITSVDELAQWYVVGGNFSGTRLVSDRALTAVMPEGDQPTALEWLNQIGADTADVHDASASGPGYASGTSGADNFSFSSASTGTTIISGFNASQDKLKIDGIDVSPSGGNTGVSFEQSGVNTVVVLPAGGVIVLEEVDVTSWSEGNTVLTIDGTSANDTINSSYVDADGDFISDDGQTILAGDGDDRIYDGAGDDTVEGGAGRDKFFAGAGADSFVGGADRDEIYYTRSTEGLTVDMTDAANSTGLAAGDTFSEIEYLHGSDFDDVLVTTAVRTYGRGGNDVLQDAAGEQRLIGGAGADTFRFVADGTQDRVEDFTIGEDIIDVSLWGVTDRGQLTIVEETNGQGQLQGRLTISYGNESIRLDDLDTADIVALQDDANFVFGTPIDPVDPGDGGTQVDGTSANDTINSSYVDADGDFISDNGQTILAGDGDDRIYDGAGDDTVEGGAGRDKFFAGAGADSFIGGADRDEIYYTRSTEGLTVDMIDASNSTGIAAGDTFSEIEYLHGSDFDDVLVTTAVRTYGRSGNDVLQDAAGEQRLIGGAGADTFRFVADGTQDRVEDFTIGEDIIDVSLWGVTDRGQLTIVEETNGQGQLQGRLTISYGNESIRLDGLDASDIVALQDDANFIFL